MPITQTQIRSALLSLNNSTGDVSVTVPSGTDVVVIRTMGFWVDLSSVSIGGVSGTLIDRQDDASTRQVEVWEVVAPPSGAQTLSIRSGSGTLRDYYIQADALDGVGTVRGFAANGTFGANRSVNITTVSGDLVLDVIAQSNTLTPGAGRTTQFNGASGSTAGGNVGLTSVVATGTTTTMNWTHSSDWTALIAVAYPEAGGGGSPSAAARTRYRKLCNLTK